MHTHFPLPRILCGLTLAAAALLATSCHKKNDTSGLIPVKFQTDWYPQPEHGGFYDAVVKGYYKEEGLDVTILPGGPYANPEAQVASGTIQFAMQSSDHVLEAIANSDEHLLAVGATMQFDPQGIMVHADSPVKTWSDLNGRAVAVKPGTTWWQYIVAKFHLTNVREVPLTFSVANFVRDPAYMQQCFVTSEPYFADRAGTPARVLLNSDAGYSPYRVFMTSEDYAHDHPEVVAKFVRASIRGWQDYMRDPSAANALIQKLNPAMSHDWAKFSYDALKKGNFVTGPDTSGTQIGQMEPERWKTMYEQLLALHVLNKPIDPKTAYALQFAKKP